MRRPQRAAIAASLSDATFTARSRPRAAMATTPTGVATSATTRASTVRVAAAATYSRKATSARGPAGDSIIRTRATAATTVAN